MTLQDIQNLCASGSFPEPTQDSEIIETHISWVILNDNFAYKIKKPLKFSFLDFSTLERRRVISEKEMHLNRRLTDGVYLEVLPVNHNGGFSIDGTGEIIDYALRMVRLRDELQMNIMLENKEVTRDHIRSIAEVISEFHKNAKVLDDPFSLDILIKKFNDICSIRDHMELYGEDGMTEIIDSAVKTADRFVATMESDFRRRYESGYTRDVHGDMHSRNIFLYDTPVIFDCVEFNDSYRETDLLTETAFFCMDLDSYGETELALDFEGFYKELTGQPENEADQQIFVYYKMYRANVRAKVTALQAIQAPEGDKRSFNPEISKYIRLMDGYRRILDAN